MRSRSDSAAPRYGVVIPTRNRQAYAVEAARSVLAAAAETSSGVALLFADASDDPAELPRRLAAAGLEGAASVLGPGAQALSMQANWERALDATPGDYLIYLGDDDALAPDAFDTLDALIEAAPSAVYAWDPADYRWPCYPSAGAGRLAVSTAPPQLAVVEARRVLAQHFAWATRAKWPSIGPSIYHGAVRRSLIDRVRARQGVYFSSFITDYASAIANAAHLDSYVHLTAPLSLLGACGRSNSAALTGAGEAAARRSEAEASTPGLTPIFEDLAGSCLWAPLVARGYETTFARLGVAFRADPEKILRSCVAELGHLADAARHEHARAALLAFARARGLDARGAATARFVPDGTLVGTAPGDARFFVDTLALGWTGAAEAASRLRAFAPGLGVDRAARRTALAPVAAALAGAPKTAAKAA